MSTPVLTVANLLTMSRMSLAPLLVVLILWGEMQWAFAVFVIAGITDLLDGLIARWSQQQTALGAMLDPVADKILLTSSFVALTWSSGLRTALPAWLTVVTLSRDAIIIISVVVVNLTLGRRVFYPSLLGKLSTLFQLVSVGLVLLLNALDVSWRAATYLFQVTLVLTVASAAHYAYLATVRRGEAASA
ncbi:MAG: CDP-alcohol phosphatidyltransferase family protein [Vicinamibacteria bacterium]